MMLAIFCSPTVAARLAGQGEPADNTEAVLARMASVPVYIDPKMSGMGYEFVHDSGEVCRRINEIKAWRQQIERRLGAIEQHLSKIEEMISSAQGQPGT